MFQIQIKGVAGINMSWVKCTKNSDKFLISKLTDNLLRGISCCVFTPSCQHFIFELTCAVASSYVFDTLWRLAQVTHTSITILSIFKKRQK